MSQDIAVTIPAINSDSLREIASMSDALELANETFGAIVNVAELLSDGFATVDKEKLVKVPFVIVNYRIVDSDEHFNSDGEPEKFAVVRVVTRDDEKLFFTDGSSGVKNQLLSLMERGVYGGILCRYGLRVSEYDRTDDKGKTVKAKTYYLDTAA